MQLLVESHFDIRLDSNRSEKVHNGHLQMDTLCF